MNLIILSVGEMRIHDVYDSQITILISSRLTNTTVLLIEATESDSLECPDGYSVPVDGK
jgi:hypothetical protein